jgi:hypothetical protein
MIKRILNKLFGKNYEPISFKQGLDLTELPVITLYQGEKKFNFLLDTGSNDSIIDANILDDIDHTMQEHSAVLFGLEGNKRVVEKCYITLTHNSTEYTYTYLISDMKAVFDGIKKETGVTLHGLLGSKFFNKYKYVLDFDALIAYSKA